MAGTTTNLGLTLPTGGDAPSELRIAITNNATAMDAYSLLTSVVTNVASASVLRGQLVVASPSTTQTLPAASANAMVAIAASSTVTGATPVTVAGSNIYGVGLSAASTFKLGTPGAFTVLRSDGTNWFVVGGQQDTGWVTWTQPTNWTPGTGTATPAVRVLGDMAYMRGHSQNVTGAGQTLYSTGNVLPAAALPTNQRIGQGGGNIVGPGAFFSVTPAGQLQITTTTATPNNSFLNFDGLTYSL